VACTARTARARSAGIMRSRRTRSRPSGICSMGIRQRIGGLRVDRNQTVRVEQVFQVMADAGYAASTIDHTWTYLNQACLYGVRRRVIRTNPAADVLLPAARAGSHLERVAASPTAAGGSSPPMRFSPHDRVSRARATRAPLACLRRRCGSNHGGGYARRASPAAGRRLGTPGSAPGRSRPSRDGNDPCRYA
jgi:hypothetical protein